MNLITPFNFLHKDLLNIIFQKLNFETQNNLKQSCHEFYTTLKITNLIGLSAIDRKKLTDKILSSDQFRNLQILDISGNNGITDKGIKNLTNLELLIR